MLCGTDKFRVVEQAEDGPVKSGRVVFTALPDQAGKGQRAALHLVVAPAVGKTAGNGLQVLLFRVAADLPDLLFGKAVGIDQKTVMLSDIGIFTFLSVPVHRPEDRGVTDDLRLQAGVGLHKSAGVFIPHQSTLEPAQLLDLIRERAEGLLIGIPDTGRVRDRGDVDLAPEDRSSKDRILHIPDLVAPQDDQFGVRQVFCHMKSLLRSAEKLVFFLTISRVSPVDAGNKLFFFCNRHSVEIKGLHIIGRPGGNMRH